MGFSGPVKLSVKMFADLAVRGMINAVTGANEENKHLRNVNPDRDFKVDGWIDARVITENDPCPRCGGKIKLKHAIEVGHTFKLGTKYSESLGAMFLDGKGKERPVIMGCYGIGVNRILASLIETSHDADGIVWPVKLCPCEVAVIPVKKEDKKVSEEAERIYRHLKEAGIDVIIDDREKSPGVKLKDSDLIGFPVQVIVGKKSMDQDKVEIKNRACKESVMVDKDKFMDHVERSLSS